MLVTIEIIAVIRIKNLKVSNFFFTGHSDRKNKTTKGNIKNLVKNLNKSFFPTEQITYKKMIKRYNTEVKKKALMFFLVILYSAMETIDCNTSKKKHNP